MRVLFDFNKVITGVVGDEADRTGSFFSVYLPTPLKKKLSKTVGFSHQKHNDSGKPLFVAGGKETLAAQDDKFRPNAPVVEEATRTRPVSLLDSPSEWTVDDVLLAKYEQLAKGKNFWFNEFLSVDAIEASQSVVNTGFFGISIPPQGYVQFFPLQLEKKFTKFEVYLEADADLTVKLSGDGETYKEYVAPFTMKSTDTLFVRIENQATEGADVPVHAFAILY